MTEFKFINGKGSKKNPDPRFHAIESMTELVAYIKEGYKEYDHEHPEYYQNAIGFCFSAELEVLEW